MKEPQSEPNDWHLVFAETLEWDLIPVGVHISPEKAVMNKPPRADVLILRQQETAWTAKQLERLPDGIRQSTARQILLEFKYTQSISDDAILQTLAYDLFYRNSKFGEKPIFPHYHPKRKRTLFRHDLPKNGLLA